MDKWSPRVGQTKKPEEKANLAAGLDTLGSPSFTEMSGEDGLEPQATSAELCSFSQSSPLPKQKYQGTLSSSNSILYRFLHGP